MEKLEIMIKLASERNIDQVPYDMFKVDYLSFNFQSLYVLINIFSGSVGVQRVCHGS